MVKIVLATAIAFFILPIGVSEAQHRGGHDRGHIERGHIGERFGHRGRFGGRFGGRFRPGIVDGTERDDGARFFQGRWRPYGTAPCWRAKSSAVPQAPVVYEWVCT